MQIRDWMQLKIPILDYTVIYKSDTADIRDENQLLCIYM